MVIKKFSDNHGSSESHQTVFLSQSLDSDQKTFKSLEFHNKHTMNQNGKSDMMTVFDI